MEPESRELSESAVVAGSVEPLEEAPEEADPEVLEEPTDLVSGMTVKVVNSSGFRFYRVGKFGGRCRNEIKDSVLCILISLRRVEPVYENRSGSPTWISEFVVNDEHLKSILVSSSILER